MDSGVFLDLPECKQCKDLWKREEKIQELRNLLEKSEESYEILMNENDHLKEMCTNYRISERNLEKRLQQMEDREQHLNEQYYSLNEKKIKAIQDLLRIKQLLVLARTENENLIAQNAQIQYELVKKSNSLKVFQEMKLRYAQKQMELDSNTLALKELEQERERDIQYIKELKTMLCEETKRCSELEIISKRLTREHLDSSDDIESSNAVSSSTDDETISIHDGECNLKQELDDCLGGYTLVQENVSLQTSFLLVDISTQTLDCLCPKCQEEVKTTDGGTQAIAFMTTLYVSSVNEVTVKNIDNSTQTEELLPTNSKGRYCSNIYISALWSREATDVRSRDVDRNGLSVHCTAENDVVVVESSADSKSMSLYCSSSHSRQDEKTIPSVPEDDTTNSVEMNYESGEIDAAVMVSPANSYIGNSALQNNEEVPSISHSTHREDLDDLLPERKYENNCFHFSFCKLFGRSFIAFFTMILFMWIYHKVIAECRNCNNPSSCAIQLVKRILEMRLVYPNGPPPV